MRRKFIDSVRIYVRGGVGGCGLPKYGGIGGKGGDVFIEAKKNWSLRELKTKYPSQRFIGNTGENSRSYRILGLPGSDLIVPSPVGVTVISEHKRTLGNLIEEGDKILVARGGKGGGPENQFNGQRGEYQNITLDLKLIADVGFVGPYQKFKTVVGKNPIQGSPSKARFPNAGKSTLLKALSRASPKIASYPFTTIEPNIGILEYKDFRQISAADLPGLIEGAHYNFGMGHKFLKHCLRTRLLLFVVDIDGFQLSPQYSMRNAYETVILLNRELELYREDLLDKPALLAVNKLDNDPDGKKFEELKEKIEQGRESLQSLPEKFRPGNLITFDDIIPISAMKGENVSKLKQRIRSVIDFHHELEVGESSAIPEKKHVDSEVVYV